MANVFDPISLRSVQIPNRFWMSPMCTYSASAEPETAGRPTDFHLGHYAARAAGGVGLVVVEATGVRPEGRISPYDLGLWDDSQVPAFSRLAAGIKAAGAVAGIQLAHAGRKGSLNRPWLGGNPVGTDDLGWDTVGPSEAAFPGYPAPSALTTGQIGDVVNAFGKAAQRAHEAGFDVAEIHGAHGYLLHSFLSPVSNHRTDEYGGSFANRSRLVLEVIDAVRAVWPADKPVILRVSTTDWILENPEDDRQAWGLDETVELARLAQEHGVDLLDCSSGGNDRVKIPAARDYQTANAAAVRAATTIPVAAVGRIDDAQWANELVSTGQADAIFLGRILLRDASWVNNAAATLEAAPRFIEQYGYALAPVG